ncbi:MAG: NADH-quinone oxidoreductase subunit L [Phycisphaerae bacterium]|nr:NADH-quinone oxidoreductase subunit L [Phycisphaerae bacterium]
MIKEWIWLIPLMPLLASFVTGLLGAKVLKDKSHWLVIAGAASSAVLAIYVLCLTNGNSGDAAVFVDGFEWINIGGLVSNVKAMIDPLTAVMLVTVSVVALLVVIYSKGYMAGDTGYFRFFAYLGLFIFSMLMLVLSSNFLMLYVFWEAVGLCSYLLIGFYYKKPSAAAAAKKAFLVNRVGDFGFAIGILLIYLNCHTVDFTQVFAMIPELAKTNPGLITTIALCLFVGACGKSAQLPLYVWLPDAMEGPSPVSALVHAATMVTAGVYMVVRCGAIFTHSGTAMTVVAIVGGITALFAATIALVQTDIKRILAYSTISQLGYMFLAVGVGAASAGIFHLYTHAFFKALLFLAAGSIMHAMHDHIDLKEIGGLRKDIPWTHWTFLIGALALAGCPLLSGFFSKDEILAAALNHESLSWLGWVGVLTAGMTAFYTFRCYFMAFHGPRFMPKDVHHPHETPVMNYVLAVLAVGAIFAGYVNMGEHGWLESFLGRSASVENYAKLHVRGHHFGHTTVMFISIAVVAIGMALAYAIYGKGREKAEKIARALQAPQKVLLNKYYVDEGYDYIFIRPLRKLGDYCFGSDNKCIDSILWAITAVPRSLGFVGSLFQQGMLQTYALMMLFGLAVIFIIALMY